MENDNIPGMDLTKKYNSPPIPQENPEEAKKAMEKTKKEIDKLKNFIVKKFSYVQAISILPPQATKFFIEEEDVPKEAEKHIQLQIIIPNEKEKEIPKVKSELVKEIEKLKDKVKNLLDIKNPNE